MRTRLAIILLGLLCAFPALGLEPYLVKDINPVGAVTGSSPSDFVSLGGVALFGAFDGESGLGLWRSDGTAAGTWKLAEVCPVGSSCGVVQKLAVVGNRAFLILGTDLWVTDGTDAGTQRLTDDLLGVSLDAAWVPEQRALYFFATERAQATGLWRTDGTPAGTHLVAGFPLGAQLWRLTAFRGRVWFGAWIRPRGSSIWRSDGTERGTVPVLETRRPGLPIVHGVVGRRLLFTGLFGAKGLELWATDGTPRGTGALVRLRGRYYDATIQNGRLFFVADDAGRGQELWSSDGTARGTRVLSDLPAKEAFFADSGAHTLYLPRTSIPGRFLFQAWDPGRGVELWASDGGSSGSAGTRLVRDICPGPCQGVGRVLAANQGLFYFAGSDGTHGMEPWASNGTPAGTRMVRDLCPGGCGSEPFFPSLFAGRLLFSADDGANGRELWATDGTGPGTVRITDLAPDDPVYSFHGVAVTAGVGRFLFAADDGESGSELWSTDGTTAGTELVADINQADFGGSVVSGLQALGNEAVFFADDGLHGYELWKSNGTTASTSLVADLVPGPQPYYQPPIVLSSAEAGGKLFLLLSNLGGFSLWTTDGTAAGTIVLRDSSSDPEPWNITELRTVGGTVFFTLYSSDFGIQLWFTDGTVAGTRQVVEAGPGPDFSNPFGLAEMNGRLYFFATGADGLLGLWASDGTVAGTVKVKGFGAPYGALPLPTVHAGRLWFFAATPEGRALWSSDGTGAGTRIEPLPRPLQAGFMASIGTKLMISGYVDGSGFELWSTDGTLEGTRKVGPALYNNYVAGFVAWTVFQGRLVYSVDETFNGSVKLWTSDGTESGTGRLLDRDGQPIPLALGFATLGDHLIFTTPSPPQVWETDGTPAGTRPIAPMRPIGLNTGTVVRAGGRVFFGAWDPHTGQELWAVEP